MQFVIIRRLTLPLYCANMLVYRPKGRIPTERREPDDEPRRHDDGEDAHDEHVHDVPRP